MHSLNPTSSSAKKGHNLQQKLSSPVSSKGERGGRIDFEYLFKQLKAELDKRFAIDILEGLAKELARVTESPFVEIVLIDKSLITKITDTFPAYIRSNKLRETLRSPEVATGHFELQIAPLLPQTPSPLVYRQQGHTASAAHQLQHYQQTECYLRTNYYRLEQRHLRAASGGFLDHDESDPIERRAKEDQSASAPSALPHKLYRLSGHRTEVDTKPSGKGRSAQLE